MEPHARLERAGAVETSAAPALRRAGGPALDRTYSHSIVPVGRNIRHMDGTVALILVLVMLFVIVFGPLFGADSRRSWRNVNQKPRERTVGSMRPEDWPPTEFKR